MTSTPYMPDSARARMPNSAVQPLPPYLQPHFSQSLDKSRPHEIVIQMHKGKPVDPNFQGSLTYRYTDNDELALVPNIWYNQTREMRLSHWTFEVKRTSESLAEAKKNLAAVEACNAPYYHGEKTERAQNSHRWYVQGQEEVAQKAQKAFDDVKAGIRFI